MNTSLTVKGIMMSALLAIVFIGLAYFVSTKMREPNFVPPNPKHVAERITKEVNEFYGETVCFSVSIEEFKRNYDDVVGVSSTEGATNYLLVAVANRVNRGLCLSMVLEDLTDISIQMAINELINKIYDAKESLRVGC